MSPSAANNSRSSSLEIVWAGAPGWIRAAWHHACSSAASGSTDFLFIQLELRRKSGKVSRDRAKGTMGDCQGAMTGMVRSVPCHCPSHHCLLSLEFGHLAAAHGAASCHFSCTSASPLRVLLQACHVRVKSFTLQSQSCMTLAISLNHPAALSFSGSPSGPPAPSAPDPWCPSHLFLAPP
eukprot:CAMPEP_0202393028 /NCGR_PEP_ID=MMETSP1127-20130417/92690_1 /ASSEMBLY_ACC=CAM_ASM_000462 /TAXON_ID=3047 /ORGANISM="Dunaliella tertiolecta, Strain CCMP1320" /LENGTH=179 /DNA_ID=CAMNT_0048995581 /DNA_START=769 /DNA_END=1306 /DNA_ORIENTATION=+